MKLAATHSGSFHADDVFAAAILKLIYPNIKFIRTRDEKEYSKADLRFDIGMKYNIKTNDFDHHQEKGAGIRNNEIPYASAGLIWKHFGKKLVDSKEAFNYIDEKLIQPIDASDNGIQTIEITKLTPYTINQMIKSFNPDWQNEKQDYNSNFLKALKIAIYILKQEISKANGIMIAKSIVRKAIKKSDGKIIILDKFCPWKKTIIEESNAKYLIYPSSDNWHAQTVPISIDSFESRKPFPKEWGGKTKDLANITGINDAYFCHRKLFICGAKSKEGAIKLAKLALKN